MNLNEENQEILDVVNCAQYWHEIIIHKVYICPAEGGSYNHKRCKYFGMYKDKSVSVVAEIEAVIDVYKENVAEIKWVNGDEPAEIYIKKAIDSALSLRSNSLPRRVFLLKNLKSTDFIKDTKSGMQGSKIYFDVTNLNVSNSTELAAALRGKSWSKLKNDR